jgi:acyl-CoA thioester hydrolase
MYRLDRARLTSATFAETVTLETRFDDLDMQRHINNVAVAVLFQEARGRFNQARIAGHIPAGGGIAVGSLFIDYAGQMFWPDPVEISTGVLEIGRSSYVLGQVARQRGVATAFAEVALVMTGPDGATPIGEAARAVLEGLKITVA